MIDLVRTLVAVKKRPVCSTDIRAYLIEQEETEIGYIQSFGQVLIKAAIPRPAPVPRLHPVGMHRNRVYYTTELNSEARDRFERFCAQERAVYLINRCFLRCLPKPAMIETDLEKAAAYSLAEIVESTLPYLDTSHMVREIENWRSVYVGCEWVKPEFNRINRKAAQRILKAESSARAPYIQSMNFNRHLARICPTILRRGEEPVYCEEIVRCYSATIWPLRPGNLEKEVNSLLQWILVMVRVV